MLNSRKAAEKRGTNSHPLTPAHVIPHAFCYCSVTAEKQQHTDCMWTAEARSDLYARQMAREVSERSTLVGQSGFAGRARTVNRLEARVIAAHETEICGRRLPPRAPIEFRQVGR